MINQELIDMVFHDIDLLRTTYKYTLSDDFNTEITQLEYLLNRHGEDTEEEYQEKINRVTQKDIIDRFIYIAEGMGYRLSSDSGSIVRDRCIDLSGDILTLLVLKYNKLNGVSR